MRANIAGHVQVAMLVVATLGCVPGARADWTFAMLGDTRGPHHTTTGVSPYLTNIAAKIATLNPELVLVCGDLVNGDDTNATFSLTYAQQYENWKTAMTPVFNYAAGTGIPIYPVRGNHDNSTDEGPPIADLKQAYFDAFSPYVPTNGPNYSTTNNQIGFTYAFTHSNVTFVAADQYFYYDQTPGELGYHDLARSWVSEQFAQADSSYEVFMAHVPMFMTQGQETPEHFFGKEAAGLETRTNFWNDLGTNGVRLYLTGHLHNEVVASTTNDFGNPIMQLLAGNGGAPIDTVTLQTDPGVDVLYTNGTHYGFALATVGAEQMTIDYYLLNPADEQWSKASYTTTIYAVPEPNSAFLLIVGALILAMRRRFSARF